MRSIGIVDFQLNNWHTNTFHQILSGDLRQRGWAMSKCWHMGDASAGRTWAEAHGAQYVDAVAAMRDCDAIMIVAPSNPEKHLELARLVLPLGKPTYMDKTSAPDAATLTTIFALADEHRAPLTTTSALRYCASLHKAVTDAGGPESIRAICTWGGGTSIEEYLIHPVEMAVSVMGAGAKRLMRLSSGDHHQLVIEYDRGRRANVFQHVNCPVPFSAMITTDQKSQFVPCSNDPLFRDLLAAVLDFFESGKPNIPRDESLIVRRILDAASRGAGDGFRDV